ncbi:MAG: hypothetical protein ACLRW2_05415 [Parasutterella excrementihominis]
MPATNSGKVRIIGGQWKRTNIPVLNADGLRPTEIGSAKRSSTG